MNQRRIRVLAIDDDEVFLDDLISLMRKAYQVERATTVSAALDALGRSSFDAVLLDIDLGRGTEGFELLDRLRVQEPRLPVIMVTGDERASSAVTALKKGAVDYIDKKPDLEDLERRISRAIEERRLHEENRFLRQEVAFLKGRIVGESPAMKTLHEEITLAAQGTSPILVVGETGTGKELVARRIHELGRPEAPFVAVNCAAIPRELFESRLFGSERGAFTGAEHRVMGVFELAQEGTLFLDEITEVDSSLQAKLLRVIEGREFERVGGTQRIEFQGRVLASSNRDLRKTIEDGSLRQDLYFRLSTYVVEVPPLRARREDIPSLAEYFLGRKAVELKREAPALTADMVERLSRHDWPGNVRELENAVEAFVVRGRLSLPGEAAALGEEDSDRDVFELKYEEAKKVVTRRFQKKYIVAALAASGGDVSAAAERIGLTRFGLQKLMRRLGL